MPQIEYRGSKGYGSVRIGDFASLISGELITLGAKIFEWRTAGSASVGHVQVNVGASDALSIAALKTAIDANLPSPAVSTYVDPVDTKTLRIETVKQATAGLLAFTTTMGDADNVIAAVANKLAGAESQFLQLVDRGDYIVTAIDILATNIMIPTSHGTPRFVDIEVIDTNGGFKATTWRQTVSNGRIKITTNGATPPIAGDVIRWQAWE